MRTHLSLLACGSGMLDGRLAGVLRHLGASIDSHLEELRWLPGIDERRLAIYGPVVARGLMETVFSALVARLDPFRMLLLQGMQNDASYEISRQNRSSIRWSGDILAREKVGDVWKQNLDPDRATRALLGDYCDHLYWRDAASDFVDHLGNEHSGDWFDAVTGIDPTAFSHFARTKASRLYSALSKGIHPEFVVPVAAKYDRATMIDLLSDTLRLSAIFAAVANFVPHIPDRPSSKEALDAMKLLQDEEVIK